MSTPPKKQPAPQSPVWESDPEAADAPLSADIRAERQNYINSISTLEEAKKIIAKDAERADKLAARIRKLLAPLDFEYNGSNPTMIIRLGSDARGWVPNEMHFDTIRKFVKASKMDKKYNVLLYHFGIQTEIIS